jgi:hypothetical protein
MKMILRSAGLAAVLLTVSLGSRTAQGATCEGNCTVSCDSGATYSYYEPNFWCCPRLGETCPDGSSAHAVEWSPVTCGNYEVC